MYKMRTISPIQFLLLIIIGILLLPVLILFVVFAFVYMRITQKNLRDLLRDHIRRKSVATKHSQGRIIEHE